jgi:hypothetical protein
MYLHIMQLLWGYLETWKEEREINKYTRNTH